MEKKAATWIRAVEVRHGGTRSGKLVVPSMRSGMKSTLIALEASVSFISLKCNLL